MLFTPKRKAKRTTEKDWGEEQDRLIDWLLRLPKQTAVFVANDSLGCDNDESLCENTTPPLSSVEPDFETCGYQATQLLEQLMFHGPAASATLFYGAKRLFKRLVGLSMSDFRKRHKPTFPRHRFPS